MISWNQKNPDNVQVPQFKFPVYNESLGFISGGYTSSFLPCIISYSCLGPQDDIFVSHDQSSPTSTPSPSKETVDSKEIPTPSSITPPASSDTTTTTPGPGTRPSASCPRSPSKRANLVKKSSIASHKRRHARRQSKRSN